MRTIGMIARLCAPALALGAATVIIGAAVTRVAGLPVVGGLAANLLWLPVGIGLAGVVALLFASWRYWRWSQGQGPTCAHCAGLLGSEQQGRYGPFRRCLACWRPERVRVYV